MCLGAPPQQDEENYHIHLIFSERRLLPEPEVKIATRSVFYDELGKRVRTKKEIPGEDGQIREGCIVIKKGEAYENTCSRQRTRYSRMSFSWMKPSSSTPL